MLPGYFPFPENDDYKWPNKKESSIFSIKNILESNSFSSEQAEYIFPYVLGTLANIYTNLYTLELNFSIVNSPFLQILLENWAEFLPPDIKWFSIENENWSFKKIVEILQNVNL